MDVEPTWREILAYTYRRLLIRFLTTPFGVAETLIQTVYYPLRWDPHKPSNGEETNETTSIPHFSRWSAFQIVCKREGPLRTLWRGIRVGAVYDFLAQCLGPSIEDLLSSRISQPLYIEFASLLSTGFAISLTACASTCFVLSPLELLQTREIVQRDHKYKGILKSIKTITQEEGFLALFKSAFASILYHGSILVLRTEINQPIWQPILGPFKNRYPLVFGIVTTMILTGMELAISMPLLNIKRRLECARRPRKEVSSSGIHSSERQAHSDKNGHGMDSHVWKRHFHCKDDYTGIWNCFMSMYQEEGWRSLYRGWELRFLSNLCEVALAAVTIIEIQGEEDIF
jgi:hypothetical protein